VDLSDEVTLCVQAMNAQRRGAVGTLIYSDPQDDGYAQVRPIG
jgi:hypothetical protein